jgi:hypothetical protein
MAAGTFRFRSARAGLCPEIDSCAAIAIFSSDAFTSIEPIVTVESAASSISRTVT